MKICRALVALTVGVTNMGVLASATAVPLEAGVEVDALYASVSTEEMVNSSGQKAWVTIMAIAPKSGPKRLFIRICGEVCQDFSKELSAIEYQMTSGGLIKTQVDGLGDVNVKIFDTGGWGSVFGWVYPETRSFVEFRGELREEGYSAQRSVMSYSSTIGPWRPGERGHLSSNARDVKVTFGRLTP